MFELKNVQQEQLRNNMLDTQQRQMTELQFKNTEKNDQVSADVLASRKEYADKSAKEKESLKKDFEAEHGGIASLFPPTPSPPLIFSSS